MKISVKQPSRRATGWSWFVGALLVFVLGFVAGVRRWHQPMLDTVANPESLLLTNAELPLLTISMNYGTAYSVLLAQREEAFKTGVYVGQPNDYVFATMQHSADGRNVGVQMRLRPGVHTALADGDLWAFEVIVQDGARLRDFAHFALQDPAENNGLHQWAFAHALGREGVLTARTRFVRVVINGDDRGLYAMQEIADQDLLAAVQLPPGGIIEFDPQPLWRAVQHYGGDTAAAYADPVTNLAAYEFQAFDVNMFRTASAVDGISLGLTNATNHFYAFQQGAIPASVFFETTDYGTFLALVDLWAATDALALMNLRYYFEKDTKLMHPIATNGNPLAHDGRLDFAHTYGDAEIQLAYLEALARFTEPAYIETLRDEIGDKLDEFAAEFQGQVPPFSWEALEARQALLRRTLNPVQPVFAYLGASDYAQEAVIPIGVANALNVPLEIEGFEIDGVAFIPVSTAELQGDAGAAVVYDEEGRFVLAARDVDNPLPTQYVLFHLPLTDIQAQGAALDLITPPVVQVKTRMLVGDGEQYTAVRTGAPDLRFAPPMSGE